MVFSSLIFLFVYFSFTLPVYYALPRRWRNTFLFLVNLVFYGYGEPVFILLMMVSITINYLAGLGLEKVGDNPKRRRAILVGNVVANLLLLGFFKYAAFFVDTVKLIPFFSSLPTPDIPLPIGISFYTFQTMSYVIDVYRRQCPVQKNYIAFGTYVSLFPQLIAGPIVRYIDVADQLDNRRETFPMFNKGVKIFLVGMAKKVLLANPMGALWDLIKPADENGLLGAWAGIIAYTLQIYFDFSGYSDMAIGLGYMFGFEFLKNFDYPYISKSITEFWRRWHISLGTWFREYVYIPLGGNRCSKARHLFNLFAVWALTGLWHGASWNFVLWGLYFFVILVAEKYLLLSVFKKLPSFVAHLYSLFLIVIGWVIFDFTDLSAMGAYFASMFSLADGWIGADAAVYVLSYLPLMLIGAFACLPLGKTWFLKLSSKKGGVVLEAVACIVVLALCIASLVSDSYNPFLYFRF